MIVSRGHIAPVQIVMFVVTAVVVAVEDRLLITQDRTFHLKAPHGRRSATTTSTPHRSTLRIARES